jgi:deoxycytidylate deaminase
MNILHSLKHDFLIIGFTGPLRSGCTTAAHFLENDINKAIEAIINNYGQVQTEIETLYIDISESKKLNTQNITADLEEKKIALRKRLREREAINVLKDYRDNNFIYISLTDMLIKTAIENVSHFLKIEGNISKDKRKLLTSIKKSILSDYPDINKLRGLSRLISERNFSNISRKEWKTYEEYLGRIKQTRETIAVLQPDIIGDVLQDLGDNLRRCGNPWNYRPKDIKPDSVFALAKEANDVIKYYRSKNRENYVRKQRGNHFVIEAFRNPYEVEYFRDRYYEFFLISLFADYEARKTRDDKFSDKRDTRDQGEKLSIEKYYNQNVSECVRLSDIALNNQDGPEELYDKLLIYFALIKQPGCFAPDWEETAMHMAYSMSVRSTCICRQVGAVIEGPKGYIVGAGWNDVGFGQIGCGYRHYEDFRNLDGDVLISNPSGDESFRRWLIRYGKGEREAFCYRDKYSEYVIREKLKNIYDEKPKDFDTSLDLKEKRYVSEKLQKEIKMMQYCRALHAEENAILQSSIIGGMGVSGGTIYTSTFPCELCAKKIYQADIKKVVYTEPYPRSISKDVFFQDGPRMIELKQFEGVKSQSYFRLYKATIDKKEFQALQSLQ